MRARVQRRGDELVIVIPAEVAVAEQIEVGLEVEVRNSGRHPVFYMTLDEMCARITPETLHEEIDWGPAVGKEIIGW